MKIIGHSTYNILDDFLLLADGAFEELGAEGFEELVEDPADPEFGPDPGPFPSSFANIIILFLIEII